MGILKNFSESLLQHHEDSLMTLVDRVLVRHGVLTAREPDAQAWAAPTQSRVQDFASRYLVIEALPRHEHSDGLAEARGHDVEEIRSSIDKVA